MPEALISNTENQEIESLDPLLDREIIAAILKVNSRCNIRCYPTNEAVVDDHGAVSEKTGTDCYMYKEDTTYRTAEKQMTLQTVDRIGQRLGEDAERRQSHRKVVIFHGGEPLLAPPEFFSEAIAKLGSYLPEYTELVTTIETNGTLLTSEHLEVFREANTRVGISLDGDRDANKGRVYANGRETFDEVMAAVELINQPRYRHLFGGCLAVLNLEADPLQTYDFFKRLLVPDNLPRANRKNPSLDFLMPLGGWGDDSPYESEVQRLSRPYATWMAPIHKRWLERDRGLLRLRSTQTILNKIQRIQDNHDAFGGDGRSQVVINTNGTYALTDTMLYGGDGVTSLAASVYSHSFERAEAIMARRLTKLGAAVVPKICREVCPKETSEICGGGNIPNREYQGSYDNPSSLCGDLSRTIADVRGYAVAYTYAKRHDDAVEPFLVNIAKT